jgi:hypothetical protein
VTQNWFASSIAEQRLVARGTRLVTELERFDRGWARTRLRGAWFEIDAGDTTHARGMPDAIAAHLASRRPEAPSIDLDPATHAGWRFHSISRRRVVLHRKDEPDDQSNRIVVATATARDHGPVSIVSTPRSLPGHARRLAAALARPGTQGAPPLDELPLAFTHGSGAVLMHEAAGHPSERGARHVAWPSWLEVADDPFAGAPRDAPRDDCGRPLSLRLLTRGESPSAFRRWTFRDTPIVRMTTLRVSGSGSPVALPTRRIDVHLVEHGSWDPLSDVVSLRVSLAELVDGRDRALLPRFAIRATRRELASRLAGWFGEQTAYPGVICSDEGQTLPVGSIATGLLLTPR